MLHAVVYKQKLAISNEAPKQYETCSDKLISNQLNELNTIANRYSFDLSLLTTI